METVGKRTALFTGSDDSVSTKDHLLLLCKIIDSVMEDKKATENTDAA